MRQILEMDTHTHTVVNVEEIVVPTEHKDKIKQGYN